MMMMMALLTIDMLMDYGVLLRWRLHPFDALHGFVRPFLLRKRTFLYDIQQKWLESGWTDDGRGVQCFFQRKGLFVDIFPLKKCMI